MRRITFLSFTALLLASVFTNFTLFVSAVNNMPQTLPFTQNWSNTGLITTNDDWTNVPGIVGFLGDITTTTQAAIDPRTVLTDFTTQDVIANQTNPDTNTSGGVAEFEIANPTVALQGSGTADAPNIVIYLNTTGQSNIRVAFNARDIDAQTDDAVQPIAVQYRVGSSGDFRNVPGGYFPDVTNGSGQATQVTAVAVTLPPAANNQPVVQVRILTTNAPGSDEWVGIDDINITAGGPPNTVRTENDYNGDGRTDYAVTRSVSGLKNWYVAYSGGPSEANTVQWGLNADREVPADYDGDGKTDVAVYRPAAAPNSFFYVLQSSNNTLLARELGATGDDPTVVGDYDGDGRADMAVYRQNAVGAQSFWYFRPSTAPNGIVFVPWGTTSDIAVPGDYDGDGKWDYCVRRVTQSGAQNLFILRKSGGSPATDEYIVWGSNADAIVPAGDYDGDGRTDFAVVRNEGSQRLWSVLGRNNNNIIHFALPFGTTTDFLTPGDYDGDGRTDVSVWRQNNDPTMNYFFVRQSSNGSLLSSEFGQSGDNPVAGFRVRGLVIVF